METTSTFKQRKLDLVKEGFDPSASSDPVYFLDPGRNAYVRLDAAAYADICAGRVKL
jgi:fatty-acyl-CoA synthase